MNVRTLIQLKLTHLKCRRGCISQLALSTGYDRSYLNKIANGIIANPGCEQVERLFVELFPTEAKKVEEIAKRAIEDLATESRTVKQRERTNG